MSVLGWVLFAVTIVVAVDRDIRLQAEAEKRYYDDLRYWEAKREEWLAEKRNLQKLNEAISQDNFAMRTKLANVRKAINQ